MTRKILETDRLILRTLTYEDASLVLSFYEDNRPMFEAWEPKRGDNFYTLAYQKASLTAEYSQITAGKLFRYWVFLKDNPKNIIGSICFQNLLGEPYHSCCLGYKFDYAHQHKGYAQESISKSIDLMFEEKQMHRIEAFIMPTNEPSLRLIERLSFGYEGIAKSFAHINNSWTDHKHFALINPKHSSVLADTNNRNHPV